MITKNNGKFFKRISAADVARYQQACAHWEKEKDGLPYPKQEVPVGEKTKSGLLAHHYRYWHQMFNPRQLLCLATLLKAIDEEPDQGLKKMLLTAFVNLLNNVSDFSSYILQRDCIRQIFARHDFAPKNTPCENNVWGLQTGMGSFLPCFDSVIEGVRFGNSPYDRKATDRFDKKGKTILENFYSWDVIDRSDGKAALHSMDSKTLFSALGNKKVDFVITDPPYASNVNYSELSDYFYIWLRLILGKKYLSFAPELTPKVEEIIENPTRKMTSADFEEGLKTVFTECRKALYDDGSLIFTFHHSEGRTWEALLRAVCDAGFIVDAVYPIHGEPEASLHLQDNEAIAYDLIHVCKMRTPDIFNKTRSWAGIRQEIRKKAREEIQKIEAGRYGKELSSGDVNMILIGKCLELYGRHYGAVIDHEEKSVPLGQGLEEIKMFVDQLVTKEKPLPGELADIDPESYVYLISLCEKKEIKSDEVHKATRGIMEIDDLIKAGLLIKGRTKGGRTYEVKTPMEKIFGPCRKIHFWNRGSSKESFWRSDHPPVKKT